MTHFNDPGLSSVEFLRAVMHDREADIHCRVRAASVLVRLEPDGTPRIPPPSLTIKIYGMGDLELREYFESLSPAEQKEITDAVNHLMRCNELGVGDLKLMPAKGHA
jgi:hypothetical protein